MMSRSSMPKQVTPELGAGPAKKVRHQMAKPAGHEAQAKGAVMGGGGDGARSKNAMANSDASPQAKNTQC